VSAFFLAGFFASEDVKAVNNVQHGVAVYAVILCVAALHGVDCAAEVALVVQYVIVLQRHRERLAFEEALAQLRVPDKLVGVH